MANSTLKICPIWAFSYNLTPHPPKTKTPKTELYSSPRPHFQSLQSKPGSPLLGLGFPGKGDHPSGFSKEKNLWRACVSGTFFHVPSLRAQRRPAPAVAQYIRLGLQRNLLGCTE